VGRGLLQCPECPREVVPDDELDSEVPEAPMKVLGGTIEGALDLRRQ
jgi:hypothetical protein